MKHLHARSLVSILSVVGFSAFAAELPLDYDAVSETRVHDAHTATAVGGGGSAQGSPVIVAGSSAFSGTNYVVGPVVTPATTAPQAEEHAAVDPNNYKNVLAAISDFSPHAVGGYNVTKYYYSTNNGGSFSEAFVPMSGGMRITGDGKAWEANSDPVVAIDKNGNAFLADLYFNVANNANGFYVSVANISGGSVNFTAAQTYAVAVNANPATSLFEDKEWIAVDNSASVYSGNVYASWSRFNGNYDYIVFSRSTDHGQTWSPALRISPSSYDGAVQGSQIAVGPGGEIYIVYEVFYVGSKRAQFMAKSTNGGVSFSTPKAITPQFNELNFNSQYRKSSFCALAVGPNGNVYCTYPDQSGGSVGAEIRLVSSSNGGSSFTSPLTLNDNASGQQFMPAIAVDAAGVVHVSWFDTRLTGKNNVYDIYATRSFNNGASFAPNTRVTPTSINVGSSTFIGDYNGEAAGGGFAHPVWTSGSATTGKLQTATLR